VRRDDGECGGHFHVAVTVMLMMLVKAMVVVSRRGGNGGRKSQEANLEKCQNELFQAYGPSESDSESSPTLNAVA